MNDLPTFDWQGPAHFDAAAARAALQRSGAILVRGLLAPDEVMTARGQVRDRLTTQGERIQLGKTQPNAALLVPEIGWLVGHPSIVAVFRALLDENIWFTGHCDIHMNMLSGWHKDSGESVGGYFKGDYFAAPDCQVYKAAVYLQDATPRDGLTVRLGSHRHSSHAGLEQHVPNKAGDVVFFDVRLSHVGQLPDSIEKAIKAMVRPVRKTNGIEPGWAGMIKDAYWKVIGRRDRLSVFFTYGKRNTFTVDFSRSNMRRQQAQNSSADDAILPVPLTTALGASGVEMVDLDAILPATTPIAEEPA